MARGLFDSGSTHSFIASRFAQTLSLEPSQHTYEFRVATPLGKVIRTSSIYHDVALVVEGHGMAADLIWLPMEEFDLILGMDWLTRHDATIHCRRHRVSVRGTESEPWFITGNKREKGITSTRYRPSNDDEYAVMVTTVSVEESQTNIQAKAIVQEFKDVFPEEFGLAPQRQVEFTIEPVPGATPQSKAPYRMAPAELKELKVQLEELPEKGSIR